MTQRAREEEKKRLVALMEQSPVIKNYDCTWHEYFSALADDLLSNGVIVPPCKVGDRAYYNSLTETHEVIVSSLYFDIELDDEICVIGQDEYFKDGEVCINLADCGNRLWKTCEEAEQALKGRSRQ